MVTYVFSDKIRGQKNIAMMKQKTAYNNKILLLPFNDYVNALIVVFIDNHLQPNRYKKIRCETSRMQVKLTCSGTRPMIGSEYHDWMLR